MYPPPERTAFMLAPSRWHINGYTWDPTGPLASLDQKWPDLMKVTAHDHRGVNTPDTWRSYIRKAIADRKIILVDTRQLANPEKDRDNTDKHHVGHHPGIIDEQLCSGTVCT